MRMRGGTILVLPLTVIPDERSITALCDAAQRAASTSGPVSLDHRRVRTLTASLVRAAGGLHHVHAVTVVRGVDAVNASEQPVGRLGLLLGELVDPVAERLHHLRVTGTEQRDQLSLEVGHGIPSLGTRCRVPGTRRN